MSALDVIGALRVNISRSSWSARFISWPVNPFSCVDKKDTFANRWLLISNLIRICTVNHPILDLWLIPVDVSKFLFWKTLFQKIVYKKISVCAVSDKKRSYHTWSCDVPAQPTLMAQSDVRSTGEQEVTGSVPARSDNILSNSFLRSFSLFGWVKKGSCQLLAKECTQILVNCLED